MVNFDLLHQGSAISEKFLWIACSSGLFGSLQNLIIYTRTWQMSIASIPVWEVLLHSLEKSGRCVNDLLSPIGSAEGAKFALLQRAATVMIFTILRSRSVARSCRHVQEVLLGYYFQILR